MRIRILGGVAVLAGLVAAGAATALGISVLSAGAPQVAEGANAVLPWAFVLNDPVPDNAEAPDPNEMVTVPGSDVSIRRSDINIRNGPPDWHPDGHPPMPELVASGGGEEVVACGYCHLPNGQGKPENAGLAGQPFEYIVQQMEEDGAPTGVPLPHRPRFEPECDGVLSQGAAEAFELPQIHPRNNALFCHFCLSHVYLLAVVDIVDSLHSWWS